MEPHSTLASFELDPHTGQARTSDGVVLHPGALLPAAQAVAGAGNADVADSRHQAAGGRRIWRQERDHPAGNHCGRRGARGQGAGEDHLHARRSFLGAPRPSAHHRRSEDRRKERWPRHFRRLQSHSGRRRVLLLRCGNDPLFRRAAGRALRHSQHSLRRIPRADQQARLRRHARPRHGERALRLRVADGRDCGEARDSIRRKSGASTC